MQTLHLEKIKQMLHPNNAGESAAERILMNLGKSNLGLHRSSTDTLTASGFDTFSITENISELLSPACGMTEEEKQACLAKIRAKLKSGQKLTGEEMRFLQAEDPVLYQQAARVQSMRESLEIQLMHSSSKQNATTIYSDALSAVPESDPMKEYIIAAYDNAMKEFKKSDAYQALPQTDEDAKEDCTRTEQALQKSVQKNVRTLT